MTTHLFAYGTLLFPAVFQAVVGRSFDSADAFLDDYARLTLVGKVYPGLVHTPGGMVDGRVYFDLDNEAIQRLQYFEDDLYVPEQVSVTLDNEKTLKATAYVVPPENRHSVTERPWNIKQFKDQELEKYLKNARSYMQKYR